LDDEFVKDVSEFENIEELKADIKNKLEKAAQEKAESDFKNEAVKQAVEAVTVDIPDIMVEDRIDHMIEDLNVNLQNRGMQLDKYLEYVKMDMDTLRQNYRESAAINVKTDLMLEAIAKEEKLDVTAEDMQVEVALLAETYQAKAADVAKIIREQGRMDALAGSIVRKKAANIIIDSAVKA